MLMRRIALLILSLTISLGPLRAAPGPEKKDKPPVAYEFKNENLTLVFQTLAHDAKISLFISPGVTGTVTVRLENKTPLEAIQIIAENNDLNFEKAKSGIYSITPKNPVAIAPRPTPSPSPQDTTLTGIFGPEFPKMFDQILDYAALPSTAAKIARAKKNLYDALIKEGFTPDQAFQLIKGEPGISLPSSK